MKLEVHTREEVLLFFSSEVSVLTQQNNCCPRSEKGFTAEQVQVADQLKKRSLYNKITKLDIAHIGKSSFSILKHFHLMVNYLICGVFILKSDKSYF